MLQCTIASGRTKAANEQSIVFVPQHGGYDVTFKDVRAHSVPTYTFFLNLPRRKVMIYFCQKSEKKKGGHRARFRDHEVHF